MYIGEGNANIAQDYNGWIDLFGWGTSGWNSGANAFQPWATSETYSDYYPGGSENNNLTGDYAQADWGYYNRINNGGNKAGQWRTLTNGEWEYLTGNNAQRSGKCGLAIIRGTSKSYLGLVLLPDDWTLPSDVTFVTGATTDLPLNNYTMNQWQKMEAAGAIFMPTAGERFNSDIENVEVGVYWSSSYYSEYEASSVYFDDNMLSSHVIDRNYGLSVRLVKD